MTDQLRAAIYARFSSDLQRDASIEDQIRSCREYAARQGLKVVETYSDRAISGASLMRTGMQQLLRDGRSGVFDVVISEGLDRLSRSQADIATLYQQLSFSEVMIETVSEGAISEMHIGLKGTMNALFLKDLAVKTHRGLKGRALAGKSAGGLTYGYSAVHKIAPNGDPIRGDRTINNEEAAVVRRIFQDYAKGISPKKIAEQLNVEGIPGPQGGEWGASTIHGNRERGTGIINNEAYIGRQIWNRLRYVKDPQTGKRVSRLNPESDWVITEVPDLRIIDDALWEKVRTRQGALKSKETGVPVWDRRCLPRPPLRRALRSRPAQDGYNSIPPRRRNPPRPAPSPSRRLFLGQHHGPVWSPFRGQTARLIIGRGRPFQIDHLPARQGHPQGGLIQHVRKLRHGGRAQNSVPLKSSDRSRAFTEWVRAPELMKSTPVAAISGNRSRVIPPLASSFTPLPCANPTHSLISSNDMLSSRMNETPRRVRNARTCC